MRAVRWAALAAAAATVGTSSLVLAEPALACSCAPAYTPTVLDAGAIIGVVTRSDPGNGASGDDDLGATFTVHEQTGDALPAEVSVDLGDGGSCTPYVAPGEVAALTFARRGTGWELNGCGSLDLGVVLDHIRGAAAPVAGGPPVAYAAGSFGASRLAALDAAGKVVAWADRGGHGDTTAICPSGDAVVATARTDAEDYLDRVPELTVHDARTLAVRRTTTLRLGGYDRVEAVRCADAAGDSVQVLVVDYGDGTDIGRLLIVENGKVKTVDLGPLSQAVTVSDGFVAVVGEDPTRLARIEPDGTRAPLGDIDRFGVGTAPLAVAPDERTLAVFGERSGENPLYTIDTRTGERLGRWATEDAYVTGLVWTGADTLVVRNEDDYRQAPVRLQVFGRALGTPRPGPDVPGEWGGRIGAVSDAVVTFGGGRLTAIPPAGEPLVAEELRLAAAEHVVGVPGARFDAGPALPQPEPSATVAGPDLVIDADPSSPGTGLIAVAGGAGAALAGAAVIVAFRRRRTADGQER